MGSPALEIQNSSGQGHEQPSPALNLALFGQGGETRQSPEVPFSLRNSIIVWFSLYKDLNAHKFLADFVEAFSSGICIWMFSFAYTEIPGS